MGLPGSQLKPNKKKWLRSIWERQIRWLQHRVFFTSSQREAGSKTRQNLLLCSPFCFQRPGSHRCTLIQRSTRLVRSHAGQRCCLLKARRLGFQSYYSVCRFLSPRSPTAGCFLISRLPDIHFCMKGLFFIFFPVSKSI